MKAADNLTGRTIIGSLLTVWMMLGGIGISLLMAQPVISKWQLNQNGARASYWENVAMGIMAAPQFVFRTSTDSADILKVCYTTEYVWVRCHGLTQNMGQYLNPGQCIAQNYTFRIPRNPTVPTTKTTAPKVDAIGVLLNGVPIYGLSNAASWNGSANVARGSGVWWVEVYRSEGSVLDTALGAHPQQQGAYHTHATPRRLYKDTPTNQHSPLIGFAFDGYPVYGPYGYSSPMNPNSTVTRMKTGYSLRNITARTSLAGGTILSAAQQGPPVNAQYPLGTYCEDYEWLASNGGDLDRYNGRFCITPDYPNGTYAYFVTIDAAGKPAYPYILGVEYYGAPDTQNFPANPMTGRTTTIPSTVTNCIPPNALMTSVRASLQGREELIAFPQPAHEELMLVVPSALLQGGARIELLNVLGQMVYNGDAEAVQVSSDATTLRLELPKLSSLQSSGLYAVRVTNRTTGKTLSKMLRLE